MEFQMEDTPAKRKEAKNRPPSAAVVARSAMLLLAAVLFVGWLVMWAVFHTRTYSSTRVTKD
jgi:cell division septal protein FtsQ